MNYTEERFDHFPDEARDAHLHLNEGDLVRAAGDPDGAIYQVVRVTKYDVQLAVTSAAYALKRGEGLTARAINIVNWVRLRPA